MKSKTTELPFSLPSPLESARANLEYVMESNNWRRKECLCMILSNMANLVPGPHCEGMAQGIADYFVEVQSGRIK
jgi:hypothetical protein